MNTFKMPTFEDIPRDNPHHWVTRVMQRLSEWMVDQSFAGHEVRIEYPYSEGGFLPRVQIVIIPKDDPPKAYTFAEAYAMMKQGKWMKPKAGSFAMRQVGKDWFLFDPVSKRVLYRGEPADRAEFLDTHIESQWTEVVI
jgi:hypothetical protein